MNMIEVKDIRDNDGNLIHAHGGFLLKHKNYFYF